MLDETKNKIRLAMTGRTVSPETKKKISEALTGKKKGPQSMVHRSKLSAARRGVEWTPEYLAEFEGKNS